MTRHEQIKTLKQQIDAAQGRTIEDLTKLIQLLIQQQLNNNEVSKFEDLHLTNAEKAILNAKRRNNSTL